MKETKKQRRDRILAELRHLQGKEDPEEVHGAADALLLELIDDAEIREAFISLKKWYA